MREVVLHFLDLAGREIAQGVRSQRRLIQMAGSLEIHDVFITSVASLQGAARYSLIARYHYVLRDGIR
jgi:hypothetical protein